jgi:hypothetical protein
MLIQIRMGLMSPLFIFTVLELLLDGKRENASSNLICGFWENHGGPP